ncbi:MAG: preprotein translocase subunit YajC [Candidatus Nanopelagicales bacterium]
MLSLLLTMAVVVAIFWFMIIRPTRAREAQHAALVSSLQPGQAVMTASGLYGILRAVSDDRLSLEISPGVVVEFNPRAIAKTVPTPAEAGPAEYGQPTIADALDSPPPAAPDPVPGSSIQPGA